MINTVQWHYFRFGDLLDDIYKAKAHSKTDASIEDTLSENAILFVSRTEENNGCDCYVNKMDMDGIENENAIIIGDTTSTCFYQNKKFAVGDHIVVCRASWMNKYTALFVKTILEQERYRYCYGRAFKIELIKNTNILLPIDSNGNPHWAYMEQYISSIYHRNFPITKNKKNKASIEIHKWKNYKISELFPKLQVGKAQDSFLRDGNDCLYLGAKKDSNGVMRTCQYDPELAHDGNCIIFICNGQGSVGYTNYMDRPFIATTDLVMGYNEHLNPYVGMFLVTLLDLERPKYSFGRKWKTHLADTEIKLPATTDGEPDWAYMENYIKSLPYGDCI